MFFIERASLYTEPISQLFDDLSIYELFCVKINKTMEFLLCDSGINNRFGFRVLVDGIDTTQFDRNPVMLYDHRDFGKDDMPIGKWDNHRKENGGLYGTPDFDMNDDFAKKIKSKVDGDYIRMASVGLIPVEWSDAAEYKLEGQPGPTLVKSILREVSITPFGVNWNALKLCDNNGKLINLSEYDFGKISNQNLDTMSDMKTIAAALNLSDSATPSEIIQKVLNLSEVNRTLTTERDSFKTRAEEAENKLINQEKGILLSDAQEKKLITTKEAEVLGKLDVADLKIALSERKPADNLANIPSRTPDNTEDPLLNLSYTDLDRTGRLEEFKAKHPEAFNEKYKAEFGKDYQ